LIYWLKILGAIGVGSATLPILLVCLKKNRFGGENVFITLLCLLYLLSNWSNFIIYKFFNSSSFIQFNLHVIIEFFLLLFLYVNLLFKENKRKIYYQISGIICLLTSIILFVSGLNREITLINILSKIVVLILALYYFWKMIENSNEINLFKLDFFWINFSVLFYSITSFVMFLFEHEIVYVSQNYLFYLWFINQFSSIIYYLTFSFGIWQIRK